MFKALIVALAAVAAAIPTQQPSSNEMNCDSGVYCCNKVAQNTGIVVPIDALSSTCGDTLKLVTVDALNDKCTSQTVCCNNVQQNGLVNVACTPIDV
ncbi:hydrophobin 1 [Metarhizium robertsii]|uniref:Class I hydrophobin 2 n=3 Tax=Metarhizium TaxID=5529 RepID=HYD2_METRA|nr:uncharacterized protein MAA_09731 [Metarhizium robertsii ARSEF 23]P52752.1 RecName: Full=Hydrophobin-like protein ssgA; Flags: Precursor [Metarhizium anisopliae]AAA33418.1 hydrophobin-like protein [Metarhizium anisopliae]EFY94798.1 Hydrophobin, fungi [Metarhizium robertsii ARSEF 23]EXU97140.1 hydrophobin 1 [Metarhizium robertsii]